MPDIDGPEIIKLQPNTVDYPVNVLLTVCSSATSNDGNIPFGDTLSSAVVKAYAPDGTDVTANMVTVGGSVASTTVSFELSNYVGSINGRHKLTIIYTCASSYVDEIDAARVFVNNT